VATIEQYDSIFRTHTVREVQLGAVDQIKRHSGERVPDPELVCHHDRLSIHRPPGGERESLHLCIYCRACRSRVK
jgi:hypothetical protein